MTGSVTGQIRFYRQGKNVMAIFDLTFTSILSDSSPVFMLPSDFPSGYEPVASFQKSVCIANFGYMGKAMGYLYYNVVSGLSVKDYNNVGVNKTLYDTVFYMAK